MPTLDATVGGASANAYATVAEATTYFDERLDTSDWDDATADDQARALIMATRRIDQETFEGVKADIDPEDQALEWPRELASGPDGHVFDHDELPERLKQATFELALVLLGDPSFLADTGLEGFEQVAVGDLQVTPRHVQRAAELPESVDRLLRPFLAGGGRHNVRVRRA